MKRISGDIYGLLMRQGTSAKTVGAVEAQANDARERTEAAHLASGRRPQGGKTGPMEMGKRTPTEAGASFQEVGTRHTDRENPIRNAFRVLVNPNAGDIPTRQGARRRTPSLVCIEGGRR